MGLIRSLVTIVVLAALVYCGATVPLGNRTFFGHIQNIWQAKETRELVEGVKQAGGPAVEKVKRGLEAGIDEAGREPSAAAAIDGGLDAGLDAAP